MINILTNNLIEILISSLCLGLTFFYKSLKNFKLMVETNRNSIKSLLKLKLLEIYNKAMELNCISIREKELFFELYDDYKTLGGNGIIPDMFKDINEVIVK